MPTPFSHIGAALALSPLFKNKGSYIKMLLLGMFCTVIPDIDVLAFDFGIPYGHLFGHRGITHSIFFSLLFAFIIVFLFYKSSFNNRRQCFMLLLFFFLCTFSHAFFDAMTNGGKGVALFAPFYNERIFLPWRPIKVAPFTLEKLMTERGMSVLLSEFKVIGIPSILIFVIASVWQKFKN